MSDPFLGEIRMVGFQFAPAGWAKCDGQLVSIQQNTALFSLLGTQYGGNGTTNFALPDLRGRFPTHVGQGPGLGNRTQGQVGGVETTTLLPTNMPQHTHPLLATSNAGDTAIPAAGAILAASTARDSIYASSGGPNTTMHPQSIANAGGSQPFSVMNPYLVVNFVISMLGIFPSRN